LANKTKAGRPETATKVLLFDVETSPNIAYIWGKYEQDAVGEFIKERQIISFAWKWLGEKEVHVLALPMLGTYKKNPDDNRALVRKLYELISRADILIGHNVDDFDEKMANTDFVSQGLPPPPPHKTIDTLKIAKSRFRFNSNKLDDLGAKLGLGRKVQTGGFSLWAGCLRGYPKSWDLMMRYNKQDVALLEKVYLRLRPWMKNHPDLNAPDGNSGCPACRSKNLRRRGWSLTKHGKSMRFVCRDCGKWSSGNVVKGHWRFT